jgi:hypothetical protein
MFLFSTATFDKGYPNVHQEFSAIRWWDNRWPLCYEIKQHILWTNVVKTIVQHHISNGLYQQFMVILGMVYYCLTHIIWTYDVSVLNIMGYFTHLLWSMVYDSLWWFMFFSFIPCHLHSFLGYINYHELMNWWPCHNVNGHRSDSWPESDWPINGLKINPMKEVCIIRYEWY